MFDMDNFADKTDILCEWRVFRYHIGKRVGKANHSHNLHATHYKYCPCYNPHQAAAPPPPPFFNQQCNSIQLLDLLTARFALCYVHEVSLRENK